MTWPHLPLKAATWLGFPLSFPPLLLNQEPGNLKFGLLMTEGTCFGALVVGLPEQTLWEAGGTSPAGPQYLL